MTSRYQERQGFAEDVRIRLLEADIDEIEKVAKDLKDEMKGQTRVLIGILTAVVVASIMMTINIVILSAG